MKRLTFEGNFCDIAMCGEVQGGSFCEDGVCSQRKIWEQLKKIEDILDSEYDLDRLRELAQADKEGISPCTFCRFNPPSSGDGKPCCMCPAEAALRRKQDEKGGDSE